MIRILLRKPRGHFTANAIANGIWRKNRLQRGGGELGSPDPKGRINSNSGAAIDGRKVCTESFAVHPVFVYRTAVCAYMLALLFTTARGI